MDNAYAGLEKLLTLVDRYGLSTAVVVLLLVGCVKYGPKLVAAIINFLNVSSETQSRLADTIDLQAATAASSERTYQSLSFTARNSHDVAVRCGSHFCDVLEHVGESLKIEDKIGDSVNSIRRELAAAANETKGDP